VEGDGFEPSVPGKQVTLLEAAPFDPLPPGSTKARTEPALAAGEPRRRHGAEFIRITRGARPILGRAGSFVIW
jgi:hypothetical protein